LKGLGFLAKAEKSKELISIEKENILNDIPAPVKVAAYLVTTALSLLCILPFLLTLSISLTDENALRENGYNLIPSKFGLQGYQYIFKNSDQIFRSYGITILVTVAGTLLGLFLMSTYAYVISRKYFPWKKQATFFAFIPMVFSSGMLPSYIVNTTVLRLRDTIFALILPACMSGMYVLILRTYMSSSIPDSVVESAKIDGANEFTCYREIVLPMALPAITTIALFLSVSYWNNWMLGFLYVISNKGIIPIQLLLKRIENEIQFLANNVGMLSASETAAIKEAIPGETVRMCLVVIVAVPIMIAYPFFQKFFVKGITVGAVKG